MTRYLLVLLIAAPVAFAQGPIPDTVAAHRYAPIEVGNEWHYAERVAPDPSPIRLEIWTVPADSLVDGERCLRLERRRYTPAGLPTPTHHLRVSYVRFDDEAANLRPCPVPGTDWLWEYLLECPLSLDFAAKHLCNPDENFWVWVDHPETSVSVGTETVHTTGKGFDTGALESYHLFAADLGLARLAYFNYDTRLEYARVGGEEYGEPLTVATEESPAGIRDAALTVFPNPSRGTIAASFRLEEGQEVRLEVLDVNGRRIQELHLGMLGRGTHGVDVDLGDRAAGVYLMRVVGSSGATASRTFTVTTR